MFNGAAGFGQLLGDAVGVCHGRVHSFNRDVNGSGEKNGGHAPDGRDAHDGTGGRERGVRRRNPLRRPEDGRPGRRGVGSCHIPVGC